MTRISLLTAFVLAATIGCVDEDSLDDKVRLALDDNDIGALDIGAAQEPNQVALGRLLFFDREISGNRDIACATCHHPTAGTSDNLPLSVGVGGNGLGASRTLGAGKEFIPRNAPDIFNRGASEWVTMFWDGRVATETYGGTPAGSDLPAVLINQPLAAQAMFPPTSRAEMRGEVGDTDVKGQANELGAISDPNIIDIWNGIAARLRVIPEYATLFEQAFIDIDEPADIRYEHAALAIAAFEIDAFSFTNSPFDNYVAGDDSAMTDAAKRGAVLFYGEAGCVSCHSGNLFTDQTYHNIATPQVGPGRGDAAPADMGRSAVSGDSADDYAFRTPPLRNTTESGPWMHDGAYTTLRAAIEHHIDPASALMSYDAGQLPSVMETLVLDDQTILAAMIAGLDDNAGAELSATEVDDLVAFVEALTDPAATEMSQLVPRTVPSGLPVDGAPTL
jgi:cytochrome c peroxidase